MMNYKSQMGQDKILDTQLFGGKRNGVFVEVGALDGISGSNTYFFEKERDWTGILIEPNPIEFKKLLESDRPLSIKENSVISSEETEVNFLSIGGPCNALSGIQEFYNPKHLERVNRELKMYESYPEGHEYYSTKELIKLNASKLQTIFDKHGLSQVDLLSIDVEGAEMQVLESIDYEKTDVFCILIENNYGLDKEIKFLQDKGYTLLGNIEWDLVLIKNKKN
jgi:FkbM family methyltransferase